MVNGRIQSNILTGMAVRIARVLARNEVVQRLELSEATLAQVSGYMTTESRKAGETLTREGEAGDRFCVIARGLAEARKGGEVVRDLREGDGFGSLTKFSARLVRETVVAKTDLDLFVLGEDEFDKVVEHDKSFADRVRSALMTQA
jgi:CRP-like cAMP-binding protein